MHSTRSRSDKVYQLLVHGRWFSPGTPASSTTKTGRHDIAEILLKLALNIKNQSINQAYFRSICRSFWDRDHDTKSNDFPSIWGNLATYISHKVEIQPILTEKLIEFHCLKFHKLHLWQQNINCRLYFRFIGFKTNRLLRALLCLPE